MPVFKKKDIIISFMQLCCKVKLFIHSNVIDGLYLFANTKANKEHSSEGVGCICKADLSREYERTFMKGRRDRRK